MANSEWVSTTLVKRTDAAVLAAVGINQCSPVWKDEGGSVSRRRQKKPHAVRPRSTIASDRWAKSRHGRCSALCYFLLWERNCNAPLRRKREVLPSRAQTSMDPDFFRIRHREQVYQHQRCWDPPGNSRLYLGTRVLTVSK
ncbi:predicted protein [Histoplasma capsulatum H143]|uniref:Uncharacterized protein n=1 Tax=Ajellomyces capsulatus (strain H143) TaxID=544712 RepID=C6H1P4_AJECH|nr:predicted protein [Histoplasma capsulatum H143]